MTVYRASRILRESVPIVAVLIPLSLGSGQLLYMHQSLMLALLALLIIIPVLVDSIGDAGTVFASKLTTALYLGLFEPKLNRRSFKFLLRLAGLVSCAGLVAWIFCGLLGFWVASQLGILGGIQPWMMVAIPVLTGAITICILMLILVPVTVLSYAHGWDPDNVLCPMATTLGDLAGVAFFLLMIRIILG